MLSAARRSTRSLSALTPLVEHLHLSSFNSLRTFSTTSSLDQKSTRQRIAKQKVAERYAKILRKRAIKVMRLERTEAKAERARAEEARRLQETREKQAISKEISDSVPSFTEEQLEQMYQGLIAAPPEAFARPALAQVETVPALPDPAADHLERQDRLADLAERLDDLDLGQEFEGEQEGASSHGASLAERLRRKANGESDVPLSRSEPASSLDRPTSPAVALLNRVEAIYTNAPLEPQPSTSTAAPVASLPRGVLARSEWTDLVLACAQEGDTDAVIRGLKTMESTVPLTDGKILEDILALYAVERRPQDAVKLADFARKNNLPLSVTSHHHLLSSLVPSHPELAVKHLFSMEALGYTPLPATYNLVVSRLLSPSSPPTLIRQGWDLYAHSRLVSHPVPSVELYSTMIQACSRGSHPSPERAIDLFTELTDDNRLAPSELAFNGVIRACAREGSQEYYFEALRFLRKMLDDNVSPSRHTFHAVLEGSKRHGDLARARWILVKMVDVGGNVVPDQNTVGLVFQTYASYRPERTGPNPAAKKRGDVKMTKSDQGRPSSKLSPSQDPTNVPLSGRGRSSSLGGSSRSLVEMLGESSLFYPGPLPETSAQVVEEARNLMLQIVEPSVLGPSADPHSMPRSTMFTDVMPTTFPLNAYLSILNSHSTLAASLAFFDSAYSAAGVDKNRYTFELVMKRCEVARTKKPDEVVDGAKKVFQDWLEWSNEPCPAVENLRSRASRGEEVDKIEIERVEKEAKEWEKARRSGRNVSKMWGGWIRVLAKSYREEEALNALRRFVELYPASNVANFRPTLPALSPPDKSVTRVPLQLASSLYPETAPSLSTLLPPYLTFDDLKLLHLRLVPLEHKKGLAYVKGVSMAYEAGIAHWRNWERKQRG
ncbi:hypothetical protein JCM10212_001925 [Sporobolomyces blumeae]